MRWVDEAACVCGAEWTGAQVITSYLTAIRFHRPINIGQIVEVEARLIHTGPRSAHVSIHVTTTDTLGGPPHLAAHGLVVVVSLDEQGDARPVPTWEPVSDEDRRLDQHARQLIELRQFMEPFTMAAPVPDYSEPAHFHHNAIAG